MRLEFSLLHERETDSPLGRDDPLVPLEIDPADLSYEEVHLISDRLVGTVVCRLEYGPTQAGPNGKRKPGRPKHPRGVRFGSPPQPLRVQSPTLLGLLMAARDNETELADALHEDLRKRFRAPYSEERLEADKRVVVYDRKLQTVLEYDDPLLALDVYVRLIAAGVASRKDLAILEWSPNAWVKLDPATLEASPRAWQIPASPEARTRPKDA